MTERGVFRLFRIFLIPSACHASATDFLSYLILYTITFSLLRFPFCVYFFSIVLFNTQLSLNLRPTYS